VAHDGEGEPLRIEFWAPRMNIEIDDIWMQENLSCNEAALLDAILKMKQERAPVERLQTIWFNASGRDVQESCIRMHICHINKKLKPIGVFITSRYRWGYRIEQIERPSD
jgi:DNA-binding response OmpR family regulator